jgi:hypothetical protein
MSRDTRGRFAENSKLFIKWAGDGGQFFTERTETHDISETGISFYLRTPVWIDTHLTITIANSGLFGLLHTTAAKVVRVHFDSFGRQLVAARFDE